MKKSWHSRTTRKSNKYNCQTCSKEKEKTRNRRNEWRKKCCLEESTNERKIATGITCYEKEGMSAVDTRVVSKWERKNK